MPHVHAIGLRTTGPDIPADDGHYHNLKDGGRTSVASDSPTHTHTAPDGKRTGPPLEDEDDSTKGGSYKRKKRKKKK